ncbi:MAG: hypothetical protein FJ149_07395 [Euryarchaeota archaeon]|nr:hypothetical protein [Euryarchaeota archaeon]
MFLALPPAVADNDSMKVLVIAEQGEHAVGSKVELTVRVYDKGVAVDPDKTPEVTILSAAPRGVDVFKYDNGLFRGNFTIQPDDLVGNLVAVEASATVGKSTDTDVTYNRDTDIATIYIAADPAGRLDVRLGVTGASDSVVRPGASVTVSAEVSSAGSPVQPGSFNLTASYTDPDGNPHEEPVDATGQGAGVFLATYPLPQVTYDLDLVLTARASTGNSSGSGAVSLGFNQFWVVYHSTTKSPESTTFYLHAADPSGMAVAGGTFDFSWWPDGNRSLATRAPAAVTDRDGKARIRLEFEQGTRTLALEGRLNASGRTQRFSGTIDVSTPTATGRAPGQGFEMVYVGPGDLYTPGKKAQRQYVAFNNSQEWRDQDILTFIVAAPYSAGSPFSLTPTVVLEARPFTTDSRGRLTIPFTPPAFDAYVIIYFKTPTGVHPKPSGYFFNHDSNDGQYFSETADVVLVTRHYSGEGVKVQSSPFKAGVPSPVKAVLSGGNPESAYAMVVLGDFDPSLPRGSPAGEWQVWEGVGSWLNLSAGTFSGSLTVPIFIPIDVKCTAVVFLNERGSALPQYGSAAMPRESAEKPKVSSFPTEFLLLFIVIVVVLAATAAGIAVRRRRARAGAPRGVPLRINCPACGTAFSVVQGPRPVKIMCPNCGKGGTLPALAPEAPAGAVAAPAAAQAPAAAPTAGAKLSIPCPSCGTVFDIVRGAGPTRIQCPKCGKSGTIAGLSPAEAPAPARAAPPPAAGVSPAMAAQMAAASPAGRPMAEAATDMPVPVPVSQTRTISCPQCKNRFTIERREGPQQIRCPHCGREGTIGRAPAGAAAPAQPAAQAPAPSPAQAPAPASTYAQAPGPAPRPVAAGQRPIATPAPQPPARMPGPAAPPTAAGKLITCPACRHRFPVSDPRRPIRVKCPSCGKEGTLRT